MTKDSPSRTVAIVLALRWLICGVPCTYCVTLETSE